MSQFYQDYVYGNQHGFKQKAVIIPNGAGNEFMDVSFDFKKEYGINTEHILLTVANHYFAKGHQFVIDAFIRMKQDNVTLVIIGELPHNHSWYSCYFICKSYNLLNGNIKILKDVPREFVVSAYQQSSIFLLGSHVECAPLVLYEAFASRTPFISTNVGNISDYSDYLITVNNSNDMALEVNKLLADPVGRNKMANKAFDLWRSKYSWDSITLQYETLFNEITSTFHT